MNYVIFQEDTSLPKRTDVLRFALSDEFLRGIIIRGFRKCLKGFGGGRNLALALPQTWNPKLDTDKVPLYPYTKTIPLPVGPARNHNGTTWMIISQGRYITQTDHKWCRQILQQSQADVFLINVNPELNAYQEKIKVIANGQVAGFRRIYADSAQTTSVPDDWPHLVVVKNGLHTHETLPLSFPEFVRNCSHADMRLCSLEIAGTVLDLESEPDFLTVYTQHIKQGMEISPEYLIHSQYQYIPDTQNNISHEARFYGDVIAAKNCRIEPDAILIGPSFVADQGKVKSGAVVQSSIIGPNVTVAKNQVIQNRILLNSLPNTNSPSSAENKPDQCPLQNLVQI